jgi:type I restriction enzyme S subunit
VPKTNIAYLRNFPISLPSLPEQRAIAHILGTLDDKIELNRRMNETLEAMARALFKSWFVDFGPVRAKMEGRWKKGQSLPGLPAHLYDLFPDRLVESELGEIPEGWQVSPFAETVEIIGGGTPKTSVAEYWGGNIPWFSVVDAPSLSDIWVVATEKTITQEGVDNSSTRILDVGTTILSARGTVGRVALVGTPMAMNQSCYGIRGKRGAWGYFNYFSTLSLVGTLRQSSHGSVFDTITRDTLASVTVVTPPEPVVDAYEALARPVIERIRTDLLESRSLVSVRDALLPKLVSGQLRVPARPSAMEANA